MNTDDFDIIAEQLVRRYACSMTPIERGITEALKEVFDKGYALGYRDAVEVHEELNRELIHDSLCDTQDMWYNAIDSDDVEQNRLTTDTTTGE